MRRPRFRGTDLPGEPLHSSMTKNPCRLWVRAAKIAGSRLVVPERMAGRLSMTSPLVEQLDSVSRTPGYCGILMECCWQDLFYNTEDVIRYIAYVSPFIFESGGNRIRIDRDEMVDCASF